MGRDLRAACQRKPAPHKLHQFFQLIERQMRRCTAAEEESIDLARLLEFRQFHCQRLKVAANEIVAAGDQREVAIPAAKRAERYMDVQAGGVSRRLC